MMDCDTVGAVVPDRMRGIRKPTLPAMPRYVRRAADLARRRQADDRCGVIARTTGKPCQRFRYTFAPACTSHLTIEQTWAADAEVARAQGIADRWWATLRPACFRWPISPEWTARASEIMTDGDDEYRQMACAVDLAWTWQEGCCAICGFGWGPIADMEGGSGGWETEGFVMDHDHRTALFRGWLCDSCNWQEAGGTNGAFVWYRARPPAVMLGLTVRYYSTFTGWAIPDR